MEGGLHIATTHMASDLQQSVVFLSTQISRVSAQQVAAANFAFSLGQDHFHDAFFSISIKILGGSLSKRCKQVTRLIKHIFKD